jgi:mannosyltransferase
MCKKMAGIFRSSTNTPRPTLALLLVITIFGAALRLCFLEKATLWFDESVSWELAAGSWKHFWHRLLQWEANMVFYYLLLRMWIVLGETEWVLRSLSVFFGVATIPAVYLLGSHMLGARAGLISATLLSVHTFHVRYSQEARSYALLAFLLVISTYFFVKALESPHSKKYWLAYRLVSVSAVYAHGFGLLVLVAQWLSLGFMRLRNIQFWSKIGSLILLCLPMIAFLLLRDVGQLTWVPEPNVQRLLSALLELTGDGGYTIPILYIGVCLPAVWQTFNSDSAEPPTQIWFVRLLTLWLVLPAVIIVVISFVKPVFVSRFLLMCVPALVLLAGYSIVYINFLRPPSSVLVSVSCFALLMTLSSWDLVRYFQTRSEMMNEWKAAVKYVLTYQKLGDKIVFYSLPHPFYYYVSQEARRHNFTFLPQMAFSLPEEVIVEMTKNEKRIWLIAYTTIDENTAEQRERLRLKQWLMVRSKLGEQFYLHELKRFQSSGRAPLTIELYVRQRDDDRNQTSQ